MTILLGMVPYTGKITSPCFRVCFRKNLASYETLQNSIFIDKSYDEPNDVTSRIGKSSRMFRESTENLGLKPLLDLPLVALSNGQTRRERIVKALLDQPEIIILDEPLSARHILLLHKVNLTGTHFCWTGL